MSHLWILKKSSSFVDKNKQINKLHWKCLTLYICIFIVIQGGKRQWWLNHNTTLSCLHLYGLSRKVFYTQRWEECVIFIHCTIPLSVITFITFSLFILSHFIHLFLWKINAQLYNDKYEINFSIFQESHKSWGFPFCNLFHVKQLIVFIKKTSYHANDQW